MLAILRLKKSDYFVNIKLTLNNYFENINSRKRLYFRASKFMYGL